MRNIDAMGYSVRTTDPLYKHIPFYVTWQPEAQTGFGLFYDTLADCRFDMRRELDARYAAARSAALQVAHRPPRTDAEVGPRLFRLDDELH